LNALGKPFLHVAYRSLSRFGSEFNVVGFVEDILVFEISGELRIESALNVVLLLIFFSTKGDCYPRPGNVTGGSQGPP
jgi:hypothetical protein